MLSRQIHPNVQRTAEVIGSPGTRLRLRGILQCLWPLSLVMIILGYLLRAAFPAPDLSKTMTGLLFLLLAVMVAAAANHSRRRLDGIIKGARGEEVIARILERLPHPWILAHGIAIKERGSSGGGKDIDHVAIGPTGLFVIETKNWKGTLTLEEGSLLIDNQLPDKDPLQQIQRAVMGLRSILTKELTPTDIGMNNSMVPVLCFTQSTTLKTPASIDGILLCSENQLIKLLQSPHGNPLDEHACHRMAKVLHAYVSA